MANRALATLAIALAVISNGFALPEANLDGVEIPRAYRVLGDQLVSNVTGIQDPAQDIFDRQNCGQGYGQCANTGECCPPGPNCCGSICIGLQPGSACCQTYICPPNWKCCGTSGNHCAPTDGTCCSAGGNFCPANWSCCGDQGYCYPTDGWHCCANDGSFCPNGSKCVYCPGSSTQLCCQGANGQVVPPNHTNVPTGGASSQTSLALPQPSTPISQSTSAAQSTTTAPISTNINPTTSVAGSEYYTTTFTYTYTIWTRITYIQSSVDHTVTSQSTTISCLAINSLAASITLTSMAESIQSSADSSAAAASPLNTGMSTSGAATSTGTKAATSGAAVLRLDMRGCWWVLGISLVGGAVLG